MEDHDDEPKIYLLPNLMTAGNLLCGFLAVLTIFKGMQAIDLVAAKPFYERAMFYIFGACLFDLLDGRLARLGGQESPFGQEFDSLADMVSFGIAPAMLVSRAVLSDLEWPNALQAAVVSPGLLLSSTFSVERCVWPVSIASLALEVGDRTSGEFQFRWQPALSLPSLI
jgi:phosphatidylserine synthase